MIWIFRGSNVWHLSNRNSAELEYDMNANSGVRKFGHLLPGAEDLAWGMRMKMTWYRLYANLGRNFSRFEERTSLDALHVPDLLMGPGWADDSDLDLLIIRALALFRVVNFLERRGSEKGSFNDKLALGAGLALQDLLAKIILQISEPEYQEFRSIFESEYLSFDGNGCIESRAWQKHLNGALGEARFFHVCAHLLKISGFRRSAIEEDLRGADFFLRHNNQDGSFAEIPIQIKVDRGYRTEPGFALMNTEGVIAASYQLEGSLASDMVSRLKWFAKKGYADHGVLILMSSTKGYLYCEGTVRLVRDLWNHLK